MRHQIFCSRSHPIINEIRSGSTLSLHKLNNRCHFIGQLFNTRSWSKLLSVVIIRRAWICMGRLWLCFYTPFYVCWRWWRFEPTQCRTHFNHRGTVCSLLSSCAKVTTSTPRQSGQSKQNPFERSNACMACIITANLRSHSVNSSLIKTLLICTHSTCV